MDMGSEALRLISDIIDRGENSPKKVLMPVELVIRKSTCEHK
jgi:DNA-binding LacI/PurR family transcriptional regulator